MKVKYETSFYYTIYELSNILNSKECNQEIVKIVNDVNLKRNQAYKYLDFYNFKNIEVVTKIKIPTLNSDISISKQMEFEEVKNILLTIIKLSEDMLDNVQFQTEAISE